MASLNSSHSVSEAIFLNSKSSFFKYSWVCMQPLRYLICEIYNHQTAIQDATLQASSSLITLNLSVRSQRTNARRASEPSSEGQYSAISSISVTGIIPCSSASSSSEADRQKHRPSFLLHPAFIKVTRVIKVGFPPATPFCITLAY